MREEQSVIIKTYENITIFYGGPVKQGQQNKGHVHGRCILGDCIEGDPLSVWDAFKNTGICKTSERLVYDGYAYVHVEAVSKRLSIRIPIENTTFYNMGNQEDMYIIVFEMVIQERAYTDVCSADYEIPIPSNPRDKEMMVPIKEAIEMLRALLESNKFTAYPIQDSLKNLIRNLKTTNLRDDHDNIIMDVKISNIAKRWLEKNGFTKWV